MTKVLRTLLLFSLCLVVSAWAGTHTPGSLVLPEQSSVLHPYSQILPQKQSLSWQEAFALWQAGQFQPWQTELPQEGELWLALSLSNPYPQPVLATLDIEGRPGALEMYLLDHNDQLIRLVQSHSSGQQSPSTQLSLPFEANGQLQVLLHMQSITRSPLINVLMPQPMIKQHGNALFSLGLYLGALLLMVCYSLGGWLLTRQANFLYGTLLIATTLAFLLDSPRYADWLPRFNHYLLNWGCITLALIGLNRFCFNLFAQALQGQGQAHVWQKRLQLASGLQLTSLLLALLPTSLFPYGLALGITLWLGNLALLVYLSIRMLRQQHPAACPLLGAWAVLLAGLCLHLLLFSADIQLQLDWTLPVSLISALGLLTLAQSIHIRSVLQQDQRNQRQVLLAQRHLNETLESMVEERTQALRDANKRLVEQSHTDALTGLYNRRHMEQYWQQRQSSPREEMKPSILMLFDLDHFKQFNDTYGHQLGDRVLRHVGRILRSQLSRKNVKCFRWGGEEFLLLAEDMGLHEAENLGKLLQAKLASLQRLELPRITASIGITTIQDNMDLDQALQNADMALYKAKALGRNRIELALHIEPLNQISLPLSN